MRLNIYDQFIIGVVRPKGGWSKGRSIAYIEEDDKCVPLFHVLIPNDLDDEGVARYVGAKFAAFARPGKRVAALERTPISEFEKQNPTVRRRGDAHLDALGDVRRWAGSQRRG
jgi:hypothetical protein